MDGWCWFNSLFLYVHDAFQVAFIKRLGTLTVPSQAVIGGKVYFSWPYATERPILIISLIPIALLNRWLGIRTLHGRGLKRGLGIVNRLLSCRYGQRSKLKQ